MSAFLAALAEHAFLQYALLAAMLANLGCGVVGSYVVVKRIGYLAGGIAHSVLGGMGVALYFGASPMLGAMLAAILAALLIGWVRLGWKQNEDTLIGALWATGMAVGILFIARTPGYNADLMSYLFGNILMVEPRDLWLMAALDLMLLGVVGLFYKQFLAIAFDEEFARLRGLPVTALYLLLLCLVAVTVVLLIQIVGLILVIALLTLPAAMAGQYVRTLGMVMLLATLIGLLLSLGGLFVSFQQDLPTGSTIILLAGLAYLVSTPLSAAWRRWRARRLIGHG